jgi:hemolysin D
MLGFLCTLIWAAFGRVDIVAVAQGRIIPSGYTKVIQPLELGRVVKIHVADGERVERGDILVELDAEAVGAEQRMYETQIAATQAELGRLQRLLFWLEQGREADQGNAQPLSTLQTRLLFARWQEYQSRLEAFDSERRERAAERMAVLQQVRKLEATLPIVSRRASSLEELSNKKFFSQDQYLEVEQTRLEMLHDLASLQDQADELQSAMDGIEAQRGQVRKGFIGDLLQQQHETEKHLAALRQERIKAIARVRAYTLRAPVAGVVQQLTVHTLGAIVTPAQRLLEIVPEQERLEVEALIENRDIGFVHQGQRAEIKVDAFPFTRYGVIDGSLAEISADAVTNEAGELVYKARAVIASPFIRVEEKRVKLVPGMRVTLEVKTGQRRLIDYFLSPLLRYRQESVRER